jgi:inosine-uridine nucleoside N-ribohydrolase
MKFKYVSFVLLLVVLIQSIAFSQIKIIFDTDFGGDADDLGALVMLNNFMDKGECELLGVMSWSTEEYVVAAIDAVNRFYGHDDIPVSVRSREHYHEEWNYCQVLAEKFSHKWNNSSVPLALSLYRKILSGQNDKEVVIITVGPLKNIQDLLLSEPDIYSDLTGRELIEKKVKEFVVMGGKFPSGEKEWNFSGNMPGVSRFVFDNLTLPVTFSGYEIGDKIKTGAVFNGLDKNTPLFQGFLHFSKNAPWIKENYHGEILDNASYDQTAVLYAVRGGLGSFWDKVENGYCEIDENGDSRWIEGDKTNQSYLVLKYKPEKMAKIIESIMLNDF